MMIEINFSHEYVKLNGQMKARLLDVIILDAKAVQANVRLIEYDTKYITNLANGGIEPMKYDYYPLPKSGELIQLIFMGDAGIPFCTIRSKKGKYGDKYEYYKPLIGEWFDIVVKEV